jgi:hypothetical protein
MAIKARHMIAVDTGQLRSPTLVKKLKAEANVANSFKHLVEDANDENTARSRARTRRESPTNDLD